MPVAAATIETYDNTVLREDLQDAYSMISPEETPFQMAIGRKTVTQPHFEWTTVELAAPDSANRVIEGDDAPPIDNATLAVRLSNFTQISDKQVSVSNTSEASDAAAENVQRMAKQVAIKLKELKRDKEVMYLANVAANGGSSGDARVSAGLPAFLRTNVEAGATGANPTLSGTTNGFPNAAATPGTAYALVELRFNNVITKCWNAGANPTMALVNANNKRIVSETFTGSATRYKDAIDKRLVNSIDVYVSDFGELQIVPTRFLPANGSSGAGALSFNVFILDPEFARIAVLEGVKQRDLAVTGHAKRKLIWCEDGLQIDNEAAHGVLRDTSNLPPA